MASLKPVAFYGLEIPADGVAIEADGSMGLPLTFRVTMAAIDPDEEIDAERPKRATLKLIKIGSPFGEDDEDEDDDDIDAIERRLAIPSDEEEDDEEDEDDDKEEDEEDEEEDEDENGGPSDPEKIKRARTEALIKVFSGDGDMDDYNLINGINGAKSAKGKAKATEEDEIDDIYEEDSEDDDIKEFVICTLDPERNYQQPLDITIDSKHEMCYFTASGPYKIYLTGNYCIPAIGDYDEDEDAENQEGLDALARIMGRDEADMDDESDEDDEEEDDLDDLDDPRITEIDMEEAPKLVKASAAPKKGKNKRPAEDEDEDEDDMDTDILKKILKPEEPKEKLTKSQKKKLKNNAGEAVPATAGAEKDKSTSKEDKPKETQNKDSPANGKKVQFAKDLEQGPTPSKNGAPATSTTRNVEGVTIDDRKTGQGKQAKKGDRVQLRYIGKTKDGKQFDANKKGKPFSFKLGEGSVIKGWEIGVQGMAVGGERRITIPPKLGYGNKSMPGIPPNSELIFDLKLISIN